MKFKKGDEVLITAGKDKGKRGKIDHLYGKNKAFIPGLNIFKRHLKKRSEKQEGGIIDFSRPIPFGNLALVCTKCHKPTRVGFEMTSGKKVRICRKCGGNI